MQKGLVSIFLYDWGKRETASRFSVWPDIKKGIYNGFFDQRRLTGTIELAEGDYTYVVKMDRNGMSWMVMKSNGRTTY